MKEENDMNLPEHYTAVDCVHFKKCQRTFGCKAENTQCDFSPSSFHPIFESEARVRGYVKADMDSQPKPELPDSEELITKIEQVVTLGRTARLSSHMIARNIIDGALYTDLRAIGTAVTPPMAKKER